MTDDAKALALAAKERGNVFFAKKTREGYTEALVQYTEAIGHDPDNHVLYANSAACHIEIGGCEWDPKKKVEAYANAVVSSKKCTALSPTWAKGYVRQSTAEFELIAANKNMAKRKEQDKKWEDEDAERAKADPKSDDFKYSSYAKKDYSIDASLTDTVESASYGCSELTCRTGLEHEPGNQLLRSRLQALRDAGHVTDEAKDREMRLPEAAAPLKAEGNKAFAAKKWKDAADQYTKALEQDPFDHVFYSNRSACYAEDDEYEKALADAERCIAINPQFAKGYSRLALALFHVGRYPEMESAALKGLDIDASSVALQDLLKQAQTETKEPLEAQKHMHKLRKDKAQEQKMQGLLKGLNMGGNGVQMFSPGGMGGGADLSSLLAGLQGGGGMGGMGGGMGGFGDTGKSRMTEDQMRGMARAMAQNPNLAASDAGPSRGGGDDATPAPESKPASGSGPTAFAPPA